MKKTIRILLSTMCLICVLPGQAVLALDTTVPKEVNAPIGVTAPKNLGIGVTPLSISVEKPVVVIENLKYSLKGGWVVDSREVQYETFTFMNGIYLDEGRCYVEDIKTGLTTKQRIQYYFYVTY